MCCCPAAGTESDYVNTLTNLFKDIAVAIDENEGFVGDAFGPEAVLTLISGLQQVCCVLCMHHIALASDSRALCTCNCSTPLGKLCGVIAHQAPLEQSVRQMVKRLEQGCRWAQG